MGEKMSGSEEEGQAGSVGAHTDILEKSTISFRVATSLAHIDACAHFVTQSI